MQFARSVKPSPDLDRVLALPRRTLTEADALAHVQDATEAFITPQGRRDGATLRPWQAMALAEAYANKGAYLGYPVGLGKTLAAALIPHLREYKRPVLCTTAGLRRQTLDDWAKYSKHWRLPSPPPRILSYEELTNEPKVDLLDRICPDLIICDEADMLRNPRSSMVKRLDRYRRAHWEGCDYVCMTGTPGRLSIMDLWHQLIWCLRENAPVPLDQAEAETWAAAIDEKASRFGARPSVGALKSLGGEGETLVDRARDGFRARIVSTPGLILLDQDSCDQPLTIRQIIAPHDPVLEAHFKRFREEQETPGGERLSDPLSVYRHAGTLGVGYYTIFDPPPPEPWREAARAKNAFVFERVEASSEAKQPLDTEAAVFRAYPKAWQILAWKEVADQYDPEKHRKVVWCSDSVVEWTLDMLEQADAEGDPILCFCWGVPMCEALEWASRERSRTRGTRPVIWYKQKGLSRSGQYVGKADSRHSAILSGGSNLRGRNLQAFRRNLFLQVPQDARRLEQGLGRTHRQLQDRPVETLWAVTCGELADGLERAIAEARFGKQTWSTSQKLLRADIIRAGAEYPRGTYRFARRT